MCTQDISEINVIEKGRYLLALTYVTSPELIVHTLTISINPHIVKQQDNIDLIAGIANNYKGKKLAWDFIKNNWNLFNKRGQRIRVLLESVVGDFYTQEDYDDVNNFFSNHPNVAKSSLARALEMIKYNMVWRSRHIDKTCDWLKNF